MTREAEEQFFDFCIRQRGRFSADEWLGFEVVEKRELAAAALLLAGGDWYGHDEALHAVANVLQPGAAFPELVRSTRFDCPRFVNMLKTRLRHEQAVA